MGCGWGGLVVLAAQKYGVDATGKTLSQPQADLAYEFTTGRLNLYQALLVKPDEEGSSRMPLTHSEW